MSRLQVPVTSEKPWPTVLGVRASGAGQGWSVAGRYYAFNVVSREC